MFKLNILSLLLVAWYVQSQEVAELARPDTKIFGGQDAPDGAFPYQVSLRRTDDGSESHYCGGSIIRPTWILTAAHCTNGLKPDAIIVVVGTNSLESGGSRHQVDKIIKHENFNATSLANDVALMRVNKEFSYNSRVAPIALPDEDTPTGTECVLAGWGYTDAWELSEKLQMLNVSTISVKQCQKDLQSLSGRYPITGKQVCTFLEDGKGACIGDLGGPLVCNNVLTGIGAWVYPCARGYPDVHARVFAYKHWIEDKLTDQ